MTQAKLSQNSKLPEPSQGQRLILDTEQYVLPHENDGEASFFGSQGFYFLAVVVLLVVVGFFVWKFVKISKWLLKITNI